ncbi:MAG: type IV pilus secretin PilQ [Pseudomonadota bacterium]
MMRNFLPRAIQGATRSLAPQPVAVLAAMVACCAVWSTASRADNHSLNQLTDIQVQALPGQQIQLELVMSGPAPDPLAFTIDRPARISLDLPDVSLALNSRKKTVDLGVLRTVLSAEAEGRTRVVLNLDEMVAYDTRVAGNSVFVTLGTDVVRSASSATFEGTPRSSMGSGAKQIDNVDFRRGEDGSGRVVVTLSDPGTVVDLRQEGDQVIVDFEDAAMPSALMRRLDVLDFGTPVRTVDAMSVNGNARLVIGALGSFEQVAYQSDTQFTVEIKEYVPTPQEQFDAQENREYVGERLTLNFQDIETRSVLQLLADVSGLNIVVSDTVAGNVTLRLQNVPWDQALDIVLRTKGLDMRQHDNVIIVAPAAEIANRERQELEALQQVEELAPLRTEFIQVNYARAIELAALIDAQGVLGGQQGGAGGIGGAGGGGGVGQPGGAGGTRQGRLLSDRGSVSIDARTNTLLVQDTADKIVEIRRLVRTLDIPVRQVLIESRIVVANDDFSRDIGVRFGFTGVQENGSDGLLAVSGSAVGNDVIVSSGLENLNTTGSPFPVSVPGLDDRLNINLPVANSAGSAALAILDSDYLIDLELSALQAEGRGEIVSTPRIITANQREASIQQGVEIPFQEAASSGATTTRFKEAVLSLTVVPLITPDDRIVMDLEVSQDNVGELVPSATGGFVPSIDTRRVITQVLVNNGETVVLGGIYETTRREVDNKVPFLGTIPVLGGLFRQTQDVSNKAELLIFVTPKILKEGANLN